MAFSSASLSSVISCSEAMLPSFATAFLAFICGTCGGSLCANLAPENGGRSRFNCMTPLSTAKKRGIMKKGTTTLVETTAVGLRLVLLFRLNCERARAAARLLSMGITVLRVMLPFTLKCEHSRSCTPLSSKFKGLHRTSCGRSGCHAVEKSYCTIRGLHDPFSRQKPNPNETLLFCGVRIFRYSEGHEIFFLFCLNCKLEASVRPS